MKCCFAKRMPSLIVKTEPRPVVFDVSVTSVPVLATKISPGAKVVSLVSGLALV